MPVVVAACVLAAIAWAYLLAGHGGYWRTDQRLPSPRAGPAAWPGVTAVVPARNEAEMLPATLPTLLAQRYPGSFEVVLVDDESSDQTAEAAAALARQAGARRSRAGRPGRSLRRAAADRLGPPSPARLGRQGLGHGPGPAGRR